MRSRTPGMNSSWVIVAIPAAAILLPAAFALVILAVRPARPPKTQASRPPEPPAARQLQAQRPQPTETKSPAPAPLASSVLPPPSAPKTIPLIPAKTIPTIPSPAHVSAATGAAVDLLSSIDLDADAISGDWRKVDNTIRCVRAGARNRAKLRLTAPPTGDGYDFSVTFTPQGSRRFVAQILSFRGRQFLFAMFNNQCGFASVGGKNALANPTTRSKVLQPGIKCTSLVKVRDHEVSAYIDDELVTSYQTDYSDLELSNAWNLGPASARENMLGLVTECPVTIESITLTPLKPQQPTTTPVRSSFKELALLISSPYSTESSAAATQPAAQSHLTAQALQPLAAASQPAVSDAAHALLQRFNTTNPSTTPTASTLPTFQQNPQAQNALFQAAQVASSPPSPPDPLLEARPTESQTPSFDRAQFDADQASLAAWQKLTGTLQNLYPNAKPQRGVVQLELASANDGAKGKPVSFFATHTWSEPLTNVTLALELVHAISAPSPTAIHYYFIPRWSPGQKIYFPANCIPNLPSHELLESPSPASIAGLPGLIEVRAQLWSDQVTQPNQATSFDANFQAIARAEIDEAYRLVDDALRRTPVASRPAGMPVTERPAPAPPTTRLGAGLVAGPIVPTRTTPDPDDPELVRAQAAARHARSLLPPQSSLAEEARALDEQPQSALRDLRKKQVDAFLASLTSHPNHSGVWVMHQPGLFTKLIRAAEREATVSAAGSASGRLALTIDSHSSDGNSITITLTNPEQPELHKKFIGRLEVDAATSRRLLLNLRATQPPPSRPPTETELKRVIFWNTLLLELRGNTLCGLATAGPTESPTILDVSFAPSSAPPNPERAKRPKLKD